MSRLDIKAITYMVDEIRESGYDLNEWEEKFMETMDRVVENEWTISEKQEASLKKIHEKATDIHG